MFERSELGGRLQAALGDAYVVQHELARGGMAAVFLAKETRLDREVALKVLRPEMAKLGLERFRHEVEVVSRLEHPNILPIFDHGEVPGSLIWYSMPYVQGETLRARLKRDTRLRVDEALRITREVASALHHAHTAGYVHRDVKPDNILLTPRHDTLLADFGIARPMNDADGHPRAELPNVRVATTTAGFVIGSPQYMSPEQVGGDPSLDGRTDQYSLGAVLYEMLGGEPPFGGRNAQAVVSKMFATGAPSVRLVRPEVPVAVDDAIRRALSRSRADRFPSISEFAEALHIASSDARAGISGAMTMLASRFRAWRTRE
ncbi:MAG: serine/threonine protein kinase [Gemmatimonadaceae bacterium]|nr:serine/threonine protein kinase [Gemmatimonadaceae bacterium]